MLQNLVSQIETEEASDEKDYRAFFTWSGLFSQGPAYPPNQADSLQMVGQSHQRSRNRSMGFPLSA